MATLSSKTLEQIINSNSHGPPTNKITISDLEILVGGNISEAQEKKLNKKALLLLNQWKSFVIDSYKNGNTCALCVSCYSFLRRGKKVRIN
jgi:hypothetical protein